jgi:hypothetical protein
MDTIFFEYCGGASLPIFIFFDRFCSGRVFRTARSVVLLHVTLPRLMCDRNARAGHREQHKGRYAHQP